MKLETRLIAIVALVWASLALAGLVFAGIAYRKSEARIWELECSQFKLESKIYRLQHPVQVEIDPISRKPIRDYQEHLIR